MSQSNNSPEWVSTQGDSGVPKRPVGWEPTPPHLAQASLPDGSGRRMADRLREKEYHPVIIFGTTASGKSTLLSSLIGYFKTEPNASISFGDWIVPPDSDYGKYHLEEAQRFYNHGVLNFLKGIGHAQTMTEFPFFIPVVVKPGNGLPEIRLAFLESKGEWYNPKPDTPAYFQPLKQEISDVLFHFPGGLSVLYVAPYSTLDGYADDLSGFDDAQVREDADLGLYGAIKSYESVRTSPHKDHHLYLYSKWDLCARPHAPGNKFAHPDSQEMAALLNERFNKSWTAFQSMAIGEPKGRRCFMQYCAGLISGNDVRRMDDEIKPVLHRYPRTVWNWVYQNATAKEGLPGKVLFPDVLPLPPSKPTLLDRAMHLLGVK